jgi:hypothetical protein
MYICTFSGHHVGRVSFHSLQGYSKSWQLHFNNFPVIIAPEDHLIDWDFSVRGLIHIRNAEIIPHIILLFTQSINNDETSPKLTFQRSLISVEQCRDNVGMPGPECRLRAAE